MSSFSALFLQAPGIKKGINVKTVYSMIDEDMIPL